MVRLLSLASRLGSVALTLSNSPLVRSTSTVLFTAILTASAKFFRAELYPQLLTSAQQLVTRAMGGDGEPTLGLVQALLILTYWWVTSASFYVERSTADGGPRAQERAFRHERVAQGWLRDPPRCVLRRLAL